MSTLGDPVPMREPVPMTTIEPEGRRRELGEGRGGILLAIAAVVGLVAFGIVLLLFPALLAWLISISILVLILVAVLVVILSVVIGILSIGMGAYHLFKRQEVQGPEHGYTLDMVKEPRRENR
jgi:hypothetical protein